MKKLMDSNREERPSFLQILHKNSVDYLPLPTAFAKTHLQRSISKEQTLVLEAEPGVKWSVRCFKIDDRYFFIDGWLNFMTDNRLQIGDFLVFWLLSSSPSPSSTFQVCIYSPDGCRRVPTTFSGAGAGGDKKSLMKPEVIKIEETSDDDGLSEDARQSMTRVIKKSHIYKMPMKKSFLEAARINGYRSVLLKNDDGKIWDVEVRNYVGEKMYIAWFHFREDNKLQIGDWCEFNHVKTKLIHVHVLKKCNI